MQPLPHPRAPSPHLPNPTPTFLESSSVSNKPNTLTYNKSDFLLTYLQSRLRDFRDFTISTPKFLNELTVVKIEWV